MFIFIFPQLAECVERERKDNEAEFYQVAWLAPSVCREISGDVSGSVVRFGSLVVTSVLVKAQTPERETDDQIKSNRARPSS